MRLNTTFHASVSDEAYEMARVYCMGKKVNGLIFQSSRRHMAALNNSATGIHHG